MPTATAPRDPVLTSEELADLAALLERHPGGLVFTNESGHLVALDSASGKVLWHVNPGGNLTGTPRPYQLGGRQFVLPPVDGVLYAWALPRSEPVR